MTNALCEPIVSANNAVWVEHRYEFEHKTPSQILCQLRVTSEQVQQASHNVGRVAFTCQQQTTLSLALALATLQDFLQHWHQYYSTGTGIDIGIGIGTGIGIGIGIVIGIGIGIGILRLPKVSQQQTKGGTTRICFAKQSKAKQVYFGCLVVAWHGMP